MSPATLWAAVVDRLDHREPATALALLRIAMGLSILTMMLPARSSDAVPLVWMDLAYGGFRDLHPHQWVLSMLGGPSDASVMILVGVTIVAALMMVVGFGSRVGPLLANQALIALFAINPESSSPHDGLLTAALWLLVLTPSTATLSLDARLFGGKRSFIDDRPVHAWPRYLIIFQLVVAAFATGLQQLQAEWMPWGHGSAVSTALLSPSWARFDTTWVADFYPLTQVGTALFWLWQISAPLLLLAFWYRATADRPGRLRALLNRLDLRSLFAACGLILHATLWVLMDLGPMAPVTMSLMLCLWHPDEYAALGRRLRRP